MADIAKEALGTKRSLMFKGTSDALIKKPLKYTYYKNVQICKCYNFVTFDF
jgi:hypothetical protein